MERWNGKATIHFHSTAFGHSTEEVCWFQTKELTPYAQFERAVRVTFLRPGKRSPCSADITPGNYQYVTITDTAGVLLWDSRDEVPCDMVKWEEGKARLEENIRQQRRETPVRATDHVLWHRPKGEGTAWRQLTVGTKDELAGIDNKMLAKMVGPGTFLVLPVGERPDNQAGREEQAMSAAKTPMDNSERNARILALASQGKSPWEIVDLLLVEGELPPAADADSRKKRWNLVRKVIRNDKERPGAPPSEAEEKAPPVEPAPEVAANDASEMKDEESIRPRSSKPKKLGHKTSVTEADVQRALCTHFQMERPYVVQEDEGWTVIIPLDYDHPDRHLGFSSYHLFCRSDEEFACCRRWLRAAGVEGEIHLHRRGPFLPDDPQLPPEEFLVHPAANLLPLLGDAELRELADDIRKQQGLLEPITVYKGQLLDGRNRLAACKLAGIQPTYQWIHDEDLGDGGPLGYVLSKNLHRRHLTSAQKREVLAVVLKENPELTDRQAAAKAGATHKTAGNVRKELEGRGEIPHVEMRTDSKGRKQPAKKGRAEIPHVEAPEVEPEEAFTPEASQQQGDLPFAQPVAPPTPTPYPEAPAPRVEQPATRPTLEPITLPPLPECWAAVLAARQHAAEQQARLDALMATPETTDDQAILDRLYAVGEWQDALMHEQDALGLLNDNLWVQQVGVPVEEAVV